MTSVLRAPHNIRLPIWKASRALEFSNALEWQIMHNSDEEFYGEEQEKTSDGPNLDVNPSNDLLSAWKSPKDEGAWISSRSLAETRGSPPTAALRRTDWRPGVGKMETAGRDQGRLRRSSRHTSSAGHHGSKRLNCRPGPCSVLKTTIPAQPSWGDSSCQTRISMVSMVFQYVKVDGTCTNVPGDAENDAGDELSLPEPSVKSAVPLRLHCVMHVSPWLLCSYLRLQSTGKSAVPLGDASCDASFPVAIALVSSVFAH
ncbi:hypothetical protein Q7P37_007546 [Cladosporium fusiforme]